MNSRKTPVEVASSKPSVAYPIHPLYRVISGVLVFLLSLAGPAPLAYALTATEPTITTNGSVTTYQLKVGLDSGDLIFQNDRDPSYMDGRVLVSSGTTGLSSINLRSVNSGVVTSGLSLGLFEIVADTAAATAAGTGLNGVEVNLEALTSLTLGSPNSAVSGLFLRNNMIFGRTGIGTTTDGTQNTGVINLAYNQTWTVSGSSGIGSVGTELRVEGPGTLVSLSYVGGVGSISALDLGSKINLTQSGSGALHLATNPAKTRSTFSGTLTLSGGTLYLGDGAFVADVNGLAPTLTVTAPTATIYLAGVSVLSQLDAGAGVSFLPDPDVFSLTGAALNFAVRAGKSIVFSGLLLDDPGLLSQMSVNKIGSGSLTLSGANTFSGGFGLTAGSLIVGASSTLTNGTLVSGPLGIGQVTVSRESNLVSGVPLGVSLHNVLSLLDTDASGTDLPSDGISNYNFFGKIAFLGAVDVDSGFAGKANINVAQGGELSFTPLSGDGRSFITGSSPSLIKSGAGKLIFGGSFQYASNQLWVKEGVLSIGSPTIIQDTSSIGLGSATTAAELQLGTSWTTAADSSSKTFGLLGSATIGSDGTWTTGTLKFSDTSSIRFLSAGTLTLASGVTLQVGSLSGGYTYASGNDGDPATWVTGTAAVTPAFTKAGSGTLVLAKSPGLVSSVAVTGGEYRYAAGSTAISGTHTVAVSSGATLGLQASSTARVDMSGVISGAGSLVASGTGGSVGLSGANTYSGGTTIQSGTLEMNSLTALGGTGAITFAGGALKYGAAVADLSSRFRSSNSGSYQIDSNGNNLTYASVLAGAGGLSKLGAGKLILSAANTYTGTTSILGGTLELGTALALQSSSVSFTGGALSFGGLSSATFAGLQGDQALSLSSTSGAVALTVAATGTSSNFTGIISGAGGLTKTGSGLLTLGGANTFTGDTTISAGTLKITNGTALGSSKVNYSAGLLDFDTLTAVTLGGLSGSSNLALGTVTTLTLGGNNVSTVYSGVISGNGGLIKSGTGTLTLTGANTLTGAVVITAGTLALGDGSANGSVAGNIADAGALVFNNVAALTYAGVISSNGSFEKKGAGTLTLSGVQTYTGNTTITAGTLSLSGSASLASLNVIDNSKLQFAGNGTAIVYNGTISGTGSLEKTGTGKLTLNGVNTYTGGTTIGSGASVELGNGTLTGSLVGDVANAGTLGFNNPTDLTYSGTLSGAGSLEKKSTGTLTLTKVNSITGNTTVTGGTLAFSGGGSVAGNIINNAKVFFDVAAAQTYAGIISSTGSLQKSGAGTLTLTGANTYSGGTTISAGTLSSTFLPGSGSIINNATFKLTLTQDVIFNNSISGAGTTILSSATPVKLTLGGTNTWDGNITLGSNVTLALSTGAQILGAITINGGALDVTTGNNFGANAAVTLTSGSLLIGITTQEIQTANLTGGTIAGNGTIYYGTLGASGTASSSRPQNASIEVNTKTEEVATGTLRLLAGRLGSLASAGTLSGGGTLQNIELKAQSPNTTLRIDQAATATNSVLALAGTAGGFNVAVDASVTTPFFSVDQGITTTFGAAGQLVGGTLQIAGIVDLSGSSKNLNAISLLGGTLRTGTLASGSLAATSGTVSTKLAAGFGGITKSGSGVLALNGASDAYSDTLTVQAGTVSLGSATALGTAGKVALAASSILQVNGNSVTIGSLTGNGTIENASTTAGGVTFDFATNATYGGTLRNGVPASGTAAALAFTKTGVGSLTLTGSAAYTGGTNVQNGTLVLGLDLPATGAITVSGGSLDLNNKNVASGTLTLLGGYVGNGTLSSNGYAVQSGTVGATLAGTGTLTKTGSGTTTLAGANTFTGATTVSGGTLKLANAGALTNSAVSYSAGLLDFGTLTAATLGGLSGSGNLALASVATLTLGGDNTSTTYSGVISGAGALVKTGVGTLSLTGANVYLGSTTINTGTLSLGNGTSNGSVAGNIINNSSLVFNNTTALEYAGVISSTGTVEKKGAGVLSLTGISSYTGNTIVSAGTLSISGAGMVASNVVNSAKVLFAGNGTNSVYAGVISGSGSLEKTGAGKLTLTGTNTYTGGTTVGTGAALELGNGAVTGSLGGNIANAGTVTFNNPDALTYAGVVSSTGALEKKGTGTLSLTGANTYSGGTTVSGGTLAFINGGSIAGNITNAAKVLFDVAAAQTYAGLISSTGSLSKSGVGTLTLTGANTYSGGTTIAAGTLSSNFLPGTGSISNNGTFKLTLGADAPFNSTVTGTGTTILSSNTPVTLSLGSVASWDGNIQLGTNVTLALTTGAKILGNITINGGKLDVSAAGNNVFGTATNLTLTSGTFALGSTQQEIQFANLDAGVISGSGIIYYGELGASGTNGSSRPNGATLDINTKTETFTNGVRLLAGRLGDLASAGTLQFIELKAQNTGATLRINQRAVATTSVLAIAGSAGSFNVSIDAELVTPFFGIEQGITTTVGSGGTLTVGTLQLAGVMDFSGFSKSLYAISLLGGTLRNGTLASGVLSATSGVVSTKLASGFGAITKSGSGLLALNAASDAYSDTLTVLAGTVSLGNATALGTAAKVALSASSVLQVSGNSVTIGSLTGTGTIENASTTAGGVTFAFASDATYAGTLQNGVVTSGTAAALSFTKSGSNTLTLAGTSTYTGGTTVQSGTLVIGSNLPSTGAVTVNGGVLDLGAKNLTSGLLTVSGGSLGNGTLSASSFAVQAGTIGATLAGAGALTKTGSGTATLNTINTYTGGTTVSFGKLLLGGNGALASLGAVTVNGGTLDLGGLTQTTGVTTLSSGAMANGTLSATGGYAFTDSGSVGVVLAGTGALTKTGAGTVTLNAQNTYSGLTSVNEGRLVLASVSGALPSAGQIAVGGGTLDLGGNTQTAGSVAISSGSLSNGTLVATSYGVQSGVVGVTLSGTGALSKTGAGTVTLSAGNTYTGGTTVTLGRLVLGAGGSLASTGVLSVNGGALDLGGNSQASGALSLAAGAVDNGTLTASSFGVQSGTVSAVLAGIGGLTKSGADTVILNAANTYSGSTTVQTGKLTLGAAGSLFNTGVITVAGGTLDLGGKTQLAGAMTLTSGSLTSGTLSATSYELQDGVVTSVLAGAGKVTKSGVGTVNLTSANTYSGGTDLTGGTLLLGNKDALSTGTLNATGGALSFATGVTALNLGALQGSADITLTNAGSTGVALAVGANNGSTVYTGTIRGAGSVEKVGTGALTLTQSAGYTGATTVTAGTLTAVNLLNGNAALTNKGTLNLSQSAVTSSSTVTNTGTFNLTLGGNATYTGSLSGAGTTNITSLNGAPITLTLTSTALLDGNVTIGSGVTLDLSGTGKNIFGSDIHLTLLGTAALQIGSTTQEINTLSVNAAGASILGTGPGGKILYGNLPTDIIDANNVVIAGTVTNVSFEVLTKFTTTGSGTLTVTAGRTGKAVTLSNTAGFSLNTLVLEPALASTKVRIDTGTIAAGGLIAQTGSLQTTGQVFVDAAVTAPFFRIGSGISATISQDGSIVGGAIANSGSLILSVTDADKTFANVISGSGALLKSDAGTATLTGTNTYSGKTTIAGGILAATTARSFGTGTIEFSGGTLRYANSLAEDFSSRFAAVAAGQVASVDIADSNVTFASALQGSGGFAKSGAGTLTLTGNNTLAGAVQVLAGTLQLGAGGTTGSITSDAALGSGTTLRFNRADDIAYTGVISGAGTLSQSGAGTVSIAGTNTFTGGVNLNSGTLLLASAGAVSNAGSIKFSGGALKFSAANTSDYSSRLASSAGQAYKLDTNGQNVTFASVFGGTNEVLNKMGLGTLTLSADNTYTGATTVNAGTLEFVGNQSGRSAVSVAAGNLKYTLTNGQLAAGTVSLAKDTSAAFSVTSGTATFSGVMSGSGSFSKNGAGNLTLSSSQTVTGGVTLNSGSLTLGSVASQGVKLGGVITLNTGSTLDAIYGGFNANTTTLAFKGGSLLLAGPVSIDTVDFGTGGTVTSTAGDISVFVRVLTGTNTLAAPNVTFLSKVTDANGKVTISGGLKGSITSDLGTSELNLTSAGGSLVTLAVSDPGGLKLDKFTAANGVNLAITKPVETTGDVSLTGGTLALSSSLMSTGGVITFAGSENVTLSGTGSVTTAQLNVKGGSTVNVSSSGSSALGGAKTLVLGTSAADATLVVAGGTGTFTLAQDQTLKGSGTIQGNVTLSDASSVLNAGNSPGTLHIAGTLNLVSGTVVLEVGAAAQDQVQVTGGTVILGNGAGTTPSLLLVNYDGSLADGKTLKPIFIDAGSLAVTPLVGGSLTPTTQTGGFGSIEFGRTNLSGVVMRSAMYALNTATNGGTLITRKTFADPAGYGAGLGSNTLAFAKAIDARIKQVALTPGTISVGAVTVGGLASTQGLLELGEGTTLAAAVGNIPLQLAAANPAGDAELASLGFQRLSDLHQGLADRIQFLRTGALPLTENGFAAWNTGYGSSQKRDGDRNVGTAGYSSSNYGDLMGVEKHIGQLVLGISAATGRTTANFDVTTGKVTTDSLHAGLYAAMPLGPVFLDTGFMVGTTDTTVTRTISAAGLTSRSGKMSISGMEWLWQTGAAMAVYNKNGLTLTPSARLIVQGYEQDGGTESDMAGLEVKTSKQSATSILHQTGLELSKKIKIASTPALLALNLDWIHNYDPNGRPIDISLSGNSAATFSARGANTGADAVRVSGAFDLAISDRTSLRLSVDHQIQSKLTTTRGTISVGISF